MIQYSFVNKFGEMKQKKISNTSSGFDSTAL